MPPRPTTITGIGWLLTLGGCGLLLWRLLPTVLAGRMQAEDWIIGAVEATVLLAGVFILHGHNWARWLAIVWLGAHVALSVTLGWSLALFHLVIFALLAYGLLNRDASAWFRTTRRAGGS